MEKKKRLFVILRSVLVILFIILLTFGINSIVNKERHNNTEKITNVETYKVGDNLSFIKSDIDYSRYYITSKSTNIFYSQDKDYDLIIENEKLLLKYSNIVEEVNLNKENPKYVVSYYVHCGSATFVYYILTEEGNIFGNSIDFMNNDVEKNINSIKNPIKYDLDYVAKELLLKGSSHIDGPTCVNPNALILTYNNELIEVTTGKKYNDYPMTFDGFIKYASNNDTKVNSSAGKYIAIHDDGTIRDVVLEDDFTMNVSNKHITDNKGENIIFNYFLEIEKDDETIYYIVDQHGNTYILNSNSEDFITILEKYNNKTVTKIVKNNYSNSNNDLIIEYNDGTVKKFESSNGYNANVKLYTANNPNKDIWEDEWQKNATDK